MKKLPPNVDLWYRNFCWKIYLNSYSKQIELWSLRTSSHSVGRRMRRGSNSHYKREIYCPLCIRVLYALCTSVNNWIPLNKRWRLLLRDNTETELNNVDSYVWEPTIALNAMRSRWLLDGLGFPMMFTFSPHKFNTVSKDNQ